MTIEDTTDAGISERGGREDDWEDPHASKISPDDPRLRVRRARARRLSKSKVVAVLSCVGLVVVSGLAYATASGKPRDKKVKPLAVAARATVPDAILRGPEPAPRPALKPEPAAAPAPAPAPLPTVPAERREFGAGARDNDPYSAAALRRKRVEAFWAARSAGIVVDIGAMPSDTGAPDSTEPHLPSHESTAEIGVGSPAAAMPAMPSVPGMGELAGGMDPNLQGRKNDFLAAAGRSRDDGYLRARLQRPRSPYEVKAGTIIPATLITAINSDLPGPVFARVREDVYDSIDANYLLIPQGSTLIAAYDSMVAWGQERVLLCWQRLVLPNGSSIRLECMPGADLAGAAGLTDSVDEHWWRIIKGATVASLLSAATTAAAGNTVGFNPTVPQQFARGAASEIANAGENLTRRNIMIQPTITVRPGWMLNVMVTKDMILEPYE